MSRYFLITTNPNDEPSKGVSLLPQGAAMRGGSLCVKASDGTFYRLTDGQPVTAVGVGVSASLAELKGFDAYVLVVDTTGTSAVYRNGLVVSINVEDFLHYITERSNNPHCTISRINIGWAVDSWPTSLLDLARPIQNSEHQPIDTAPKDRPILASDDPEDGKAERVAFWDRSGRWVSLIDDPTSPVVTPWQKGQPTHWREIPK